MSEKYMSVKEAAEYLKVSKPKMIRLIADNGINTFQDPRDKRKTLIQRVDVERLKNPVPKKSKPSNKR
jgi:excisionase family DNA binding protein